MQIENLSVQIKNAHASGNFIKTGKLINKAREDGVNLGLLVLNAIKNA